VNPRIFCREPGYDAAICCTYSYDPIFFERVVLHDLWAGGSRDVLVIADASQARDALRRAAGHLTYLGRRYQLAVIDGVGAQHAKLIVRIGREGAVVWVGSNNLTSGAWSGANHELATAWQIKKDDVASCRNLRQILAGFLPFLTGSAAAMIERAIDQEWLAGESESLNKPAVVLSGESTLATSLSERWKGRSFESAFIMTGSTDEGGAMLRWLGQTFGVKKAVVALDPKRGCFRPVLIGRLPLSVSVVPLDGSPMPHAKLVWLTGRKGSAAVMGSANCSAAAWVRPVKQGGNIESVVVFDECVQQDFATVLKIFERTAVSLEQAGLGESVVKEVAEEESCSFRLLELACNAQIGELRASVLPGIKSAEAVELEMAGLRMPLRAADEMGQIWIGMMPDITGGMTHFGRLVVRYSPKQVEVSREVWLNEEDELQQAARGRQIAESIGNLSRPPSATSAQQKLLTELTRVAAFLFSDSGSFADPFRTEKASGKEITEAHEPVAVDPDVLVRSLSEVREQSGRLSGKAQFGMTLPLMGVMRVLFPSPLEEDEQRLGEESEEERLREKQENIASESGVAGDLPAEQLRKRLVDQMDRFIESLREPEFAHRCTATQLVQAVAFPLAVGIKALDGCWIDSSIADRWTFQVCDVLFRVQQAESNGSKKIGLLGAVRERYLHEGRSAIFDKIVGDGRLWVALTVALNRVLPRDKRTRLERALALRDVYGDTMLSRHAKASTLELLLARAAAEGRNGRKGLIEARKAARTIAEIERRLVTDWERYAKNQLGEEYFEGDSVWKQGMGFGHCENAGIIEDRGRVSIYLRARAKVCPVVVTYYVNLRIAADLDQGLNNLVARL